MQPTPAVVLVHLSSVLLLIWPTHLPFCYCVTSYDISSMPKSTIPHGTKDIPASCEMALRRSRPTIQSHSNKSRSIIFLINSFLFEEYILRRSSGVQRTLGIL
ncbi:hypothetical protein KIN20_018487 [Parelaphostrongylus tenuis]|uniref:Secreted protein n=1 Tax=Parelaphostrongylus tenuis TaxID=148309 RepID=A0AAD5MPX6_PARTN|nr:hypothetical protein KIN20_018487 [Parelaphostrongylus tenuis]